ncbi:MAG: TetR/AcrR family transcriptional regulator [Micrococcaceae bacterium]
MGRPRQDQGPSAVQRLEAAFFNELRQTPYPGITISAIVRAAGVNRNSFYYHYSDLGDLAHSAVTHLMVSGVPRLIAEGFSIGSQEVDRLIDEGANDENFARMVIVAGPHSTAELREILKGALVDIWAAAFDLDLDTLTPEARSTVQFVLGGLLELLADIERRHRSNGQEVRYREVFAQTRKLPIVQLNVLHLVEMLKDAGERGAP